MVNETKTEKMIIYKRQCPTCNREFRTPYRNDLFCTWDCLEKFYEKPNAYELICRTYARIYDMEYIPVP